MDDLTTWSGFKEGGTTVTEPKMVTGWSSVEHVTRTVRYDFRDGARAIVRQVQAVLTGAPTGMFTPAQLQTLQRLAKSELEKVSDRVKRAFESKKMGLHELASFARKELVMLVIKKATPKYATAWRDAGMTPTEYFDKFYRDYFVRFELPGNSISIVDPNLHLHLKKQSALPAVTRSVNAKLPV
jgi:hypothetical protein